MANITKVDAQGLSCPQPVILTRNALKQAATNAVVEVLVDSGTSRDNCARAAAKAGWTAIIEDQPGGVYKLVMKR
jgi:TusA-related sulfurtransferase